LNRTMATNQSAFLDKAGTPLRVGESPMPSPGPDDIVIRNRAIAINPLDHKQADTGRFVKAFPAVLGNDVAGEVHEIGSNVTRFRVGDRVFGHVWGLTSGKNEDGAFSLYSRLPSRNAAIVPDNVKLPEAVVLPLAIDTACSGLFKEKPMLKIAYPELDTPSTGQVIVVYGASSSIGATTTQLATAAGVRIIAIASQHNFELCRTCGATEVFDYKSDNLVADVVEAVDKDSFIGIYDAIADPSTLAHDVAILEKLGGGSLVTSGAAPEDVPHDSTATRMFGLGDFSFPVWENFVTPALEQDKLRCLPEPLVIGQGLESLQAGLDRLRSGVSGRKVVVELQP
jgi:NADPH:quinone reductase-like Zn-dependent oxidoreductase